MVKQKNLDFGALLEQILAFRRERDWEQFHTPKDLAIALNLEASEVLEHFVWKSKEEMERYVKEKRVEIGDELADVLYWVLLLAHDMDIDLVEAFGRKMEKNEKKYPVSKAKGKHLKYTELT